MELLADVGTETPAAMLEAVSALLYARHAQPTLVHHAAVPPSSTSQPPRMTSTPFSVVTAEAPLLEATVDLNGARWQDHSGDWVDQRSTQHYAHSAPAVPSMDGVMYAASTYHAPPTAPAMQQMPEFTTRGLAAGGKDTPQYQQQQQQWPQRALVQRERSVAEQVAVRDGPDQTQKQREQELVKQWNRERLRVEKEEKKRVRQAKAAAKEEAKRQKQAQTATKQQQQQHLTPKTQAGTTNEAVQSTISQSEYNRTAPVDTSRRTSIILPGMSILPPPYQHRPHIIEIDPRLRGFVGGPTGSQPTTASYHGAAAASASSSHRPSHRTSTASRRFPSPAFPSADTEPSRYPSNWMARPRQHGIQQATTGTSQHPVTMHRKVNHRQPTQSKQRRATLSGPRNSTMYDPQGHPPRSSQFGQALWSNQEQESPAANVVDPTFQNVPMATGPTTWTSLNTESVLPSLAIRSTKRPATLGDLWDSMLPSQPSMSDATAPALFSSASSRDATKVNGVSCDSGETKTLAQPTSDWYYPTENRPSTQVSAARGYNYTHQPQQSAVTRGDVKEQGRISGPASMEPGDAKTQTPVLVGAGLATKTKPDGKPLSSNRMRKLEKQDKRRERHTMKQDGKHPSQGTGRTPLGLPPTVASLKPNGVMIPTMPVAKRRHSSSTKAAPSTSMDPTEYARRQLEAQQKELLNQARFTLFTQQQQLLQRRTTDSKPIPPRLIPTIVIQSGTANSNKRPRLAAAVQRDPGTRAQSSVPRTETVHTNSSGISQLGSNLREVDAVYDTLDKPGLMLFPPSALQPVHPTIAPAPSSVSATEDVAPLANVTDDSSLKRAPKTKTRKRKAAPLAVAVDASPIIPESLDRTRSAQARQDAGTHSVPGSTDAKAVDAAISSVSVPAVASDRDTTSARIRPQAETVMIFCKRDFFRFQAGLLWRKYQKIKRKRDSMMATVVGRRARYLSARYQNPDQGKPAEQTGSRKRRRIKGDKHVTANDQAAREVVEILHDDSDSRCELVVEGVPRSEGAQEDTNASDVGVADDGSSTSPAPDRNAPAASSTADQTEVATTEPLPAPGSTDAPGVNVVVHVEANEIKSLTPSQIDVGHEEEPPGQVTVVMNGVCDAEIDDTPDAATEKGERTIESVMKELASSVTTEGMEEGVAKARCTHEPILQLEDDAPVEADATGVATGDGSSKTPSSTRLLEQPVIGSTGDGSTDQSSAQDVVNERGPSIEDTTSEMSIDSQAVTTDGTHLVAPQCDADRTGDGDVVVHQLAEETDVCSTSELQPARDCVSLQPPPADAAPLDETGSASQPELALALGADSPVSEGRHSSPEEPSSRDIEVATHSSGATREHTIDQPSPRQVVSSDIHDQGPASMNDIVDVAMTEDLVPPVNVPRRDVAKTLDGVESGDRGNPLQGDENPHSGSTDAMLLPNAGDQLVRVDGESTGEKSEALDQDFSTVDAVYSTGPLVAAADEPSSDTCPVDELGLVQSPSSTVESMCEPNQADHCEPTGSDARVADAPTAAAQPVDSQDTVQLVVQQLVDQCCEAVEPVADLEQSLVVEETKPQPSTTPSPVQGVTTSAAWPTDSSCDNLFVIVDEDMFAGWTPPPDTTSSSSTSMTPGPSPKTSSSDAKEPSDPESSMACDVAAIDGVAS